MRYATFIFLLLVTLALRTFGQERGSGTGGGGTGGAATNNIIQIQGTAGTFLTNGPLNKNAMYIPGQTDYMDVQGPLNGAKQLAGGSYFSFDWTNSFSIGVWYKIDTGDAGSVLWAHTWGQDPGFELDLGYESGLSTPYTSFVIASQYGYAPNAGAPTLAVTNRAYINDGKFHHYTVTYNGSGNATGMVLYVDGITNGSAIMLNQPFTNGISILSYQPFRIGASLSDDGDAIGGAVSGLSVFNRVLTAAEANNLTNNTIPANGLLAYFPFAETNGQSVYSQINPPYVKSVIASAAAYANVAGGLTGTLTGTQAADPNQNIYNSMFGPTSVYWQGNQSLDFSAFTNVVFRNIKTTGTGTKIPTAVTLSGSPFTYTNNTPTALECYFSGGTAYSVTKNGAGVFGSLVGDGYFLLQPTNKCVITYTVAPTFYTNSFY